MSKKQSTLKAQKDKTFFRISPKKKTKWKMVGKKGKEATIESEGGLTRFKPLSLVVYPV